MQFKILSLDVMSSYFLIWFANLNYIFFVDFLHLLRFFLLDAQALFFPTNCFFIVAATFFFPYKILAQEFKNDSLIVLLTKIEHGCIWKRVKCTIKKGSSLGSCSIWKSNVWLLLKIRPAISCIHCELCDHSPCDFRCESWLAVYPSMLKVIIWHTITQIMPKQRCKRNGRMLQKNDVFYCDFKV